MEKDWSNIYTTNQVYLADIAKAVLADNNIESVIINKKDSAYKSFGDIEVWVHNSNKDTAELLLKEL